MKIGLFEAFGIELEYMIVKKNGLDINPVSDYLLRDKKGKIVNVVDKGKVAWSNELAMHVAEIKNPVPVKDVYTLVKPVTEQIVWANSILSEIDAMLLPSAMHPLARPGKNIKLWPGDNNEIYSAYDRIFGCKGHGWFNVQSMHLNLPFKNSDEFARLHSAIRLLLPLLPGLAASSPFTAGKFSGRLDNRLYFYSRNQRKIPEITGAVVPEYIQSISDYKSLVLEKIYKAAAPHDPDGLLHGEWLNSRGAIARFDRNAIEIRVLDVKENPSSDISIAALIISILKGMVRDGIIMDIETSRLARVFKKSLVLAEHAPVTDRVYLAALQAKEGSAREVLLQLIDRYHKKNKNSEEFLETYRKHGTLASRLRKATGKSGNFDKTYKRLAVNLAENRMFIP